MFTGNERGIFFLNGQKDLVKQLDFSTFRFSLALAFFCFFASNSVSAQVPIYENGQPIMTGTEVGVHPDTPTRKKIDLNGEWSYSFNGDDWMTVRVPSAFDYEGTVTFLRKFTVDEEMLSQRAVKLVALGINYDAEVTVNDQFIGRHVGGYTSFEFEIPESVLRLGTENALKIVVQNDLNARTTLPLRKQIWGWKNYGGITRDIYLLLTPRTWIDAANIHSELGSDLRQGTVRVSATLTSARATLQESSGNDEQPHFIQLELFDKQNNTIVAQSAIAPVSVGQNRLVEVQTSLTIANAKPWSPETPELYRLRVNLIEGQGNQRKVIDIIERNIGFSKIVIENRALIVNGKSTALKGVVWHEDTPAHGSAMTYEEMEKDVALMKTLGANAVRFAFHAPHPYMLNLCSRYGLFVLEEIPAWNAPAEILSAEHFQVLAESVMRETIQRDRHQPSLLAWGIGSEFDSSDLRAREYVERLAAFARTLDSRFVYFGSRMPENDTCLDLVDFAALVAPRVNEVEFKELLSDWKRLANDKPVFVLGYSKAVEHGNRNGYSDPLSEEAQARYFEVRYRSVKELGYAGSFIDAFADWRGDRPIMTVNLGAPFIHPVGLVNAEREKRTVFDVVRSLYNEEKLVSLPIGSHRSSFPAAPLVFGLVVIFTVAYMVHYNRRFNDCFTRSLLRPYNFFADLRDVNVVANLHTLMLAVAIAVTMAVVVVSLLFQYRTNIDVDYVVTQIVVSDWLKLQLIDATWSLFYGITLFTGVFLLGLVVVASAIKFFAMLVRVKVYWYHAYSVAVWGALPYVFLIIPGMILLKLLDSPTYVMPVLVLVGVFDLWVLFRVLKGTAVVYGTSPLKAYGGGLLVCLAVFGIMWFYYDAVYAFGAYLEFIVHISRSLG